MNFFEVDEGGGGLPVKVSREGGASGEVSLYLADHRDDYVLMIDGRQDGRINVDSSTLTKTVPVTVLKKSRLKSALGSGRSNALVGEISSPYLQPFSGAWGGGPPDVMMDINLGLSQNGQQLPPLRVRYLDGGYTLPEHIDIVAIPTGNPSVKKYRLPQATLTIGPGFSFAPPDVAPDDDTGNYVSYLFNGTPGEYPDFRGTFIKWTRTFHSSDTTRVDESNGPQLGFGFSPVGGPDFSVEDWHEHEAAVQRKFRFVRSFSFPNADDVITSDGDGTVASHTRIEYQVYVTELGSDIPDDPTTTELDFLAPKKEIHGYGSDTALTTEQLLTASNEARGVKQPDGSTSSSILNTFVNPTGAPGTTKRVVRTWLDASPAGVLNGSETVTNLLVTDYQYSADWTGLNVLPSRVLTSVESRLLNDESISYLNDVAVSVREPTAEETTNGVTPKQLVVVATRTVSDQPEAAGENRHALESVSKKFQSNTPDFFYADLFYSLQNEDGTKQSFAYQRGNIESDGTFTAVEAPDLPSALATNAVRTVTFSGLKADAAGTVAVSSSPTFPGLNFDPLILMIGRSTATVEVRRYGLPIRTETWVCSTAGGEFELVAWQTSEYTPYGGVKARTASNGATYSAQWSGFRKDSETDETGLTTTYHYDSGGRVDIITRGAVGSVPEMRMAYAYDGDNHVIKVTVGPETGQHLVTIYRYNQAGLLEHQEDPNGATVDYAYANGGRQMTITSNKGVAGVEATRVIDNFVDGRVRSITGTAVLPEYHHYDAESLNSDATPPVAYSLPRTTVYFGADKTESTTPPRYQTVVSDLLGRTVEQRSPGPPDSTLTVAKQFRYNASGQLDRVRTVGRVGTTEHRLSADTLFVYDDFGQLSASGLDVSDDGVLGDASTDRFVRTETKFTNRETSDWWAYVGTRSFEKGGSATALETKVYTRLTGFDSNVIGQAQFCDIHDNLTDASTVLTTQAGSTVKLRTEITEMPGGSASYRDYAGGFLVTERAYAGNVTPSATNYSSIVTHSYDALGRATGTTDARGISTTTTYWDNETLPHYVYSGKDADNNPILTATYGYDAASRVTSVQDAASNSSNFAYNVRGQLTDEWGTATHPVHHVYDDTYFHEKERWTYRSVTAGDRPVVDSQLGTVTVTPHDTTKWDCDPATGLLLTKTDAANHDTDYTYSYDFTTGEKLVGRTSARNITALSHYAIATGDLTDVTYSDTAATHPTPPIHYTYDRGRLTGVTDATGARTFSYDDFGQPLGEFLPAFFGSRVLTTQYQTATSSSAHTIKGRYNGVKFGSAVADTDAGDDSVMSVTYGHDGLGRIQSVAASYPGSSYSTSATYDYTGGTSHWEKLTHGSYSLKRELETSRDLLASVSSRYGESTSAPIAEFTYSHDDRGLRKSTQQTGTAYDDFGDATFAKHSYDASGQLEESTGYLGHFLGDDTDTSRPLPGREHHFAYDSAGNRTSAKIGTETASYTNDEVSPVAPGGNALNQVKQRTNLPPHVSGTAPSASTVTVNGTTAASRQGRYWDAGLGNLPAAGSFSTLSISATAAAPADNRSGTAALLARPATETFSYDENGNLTGDGLWNYVWDAEDRLIQMTTSTTAHAFGMPDQSITFTYDYLGRRVRKQFSGYTSSVASPAATDTVFVWDDWLLLAEFKVASTLNAQPSTLNLACTYVWGLDVAGGLTATGGVGALVFSVHHTGPALTVRDVAYDGAGNVVALVNPDTGAPTASYEYDPFGQTLRSAGAEAAGNPFRFSTKYCDPETSLYYYGYRYYDTTLGRFLNRDPLEEDGGNNLYAFVGNNPINGSDYLGMVWWNPFSWFGGSSGGATTGASGPTAADLAGRPQNTGNGGGGGFTWSISSFGSGEPSPESEIFEDEPGTSNSPAKEIFKLPLQQDPRRDIADRFNDPNSVTVPMLEERLSALRAANSIWTRDREVEARSSLGGSPYEARIRALSSAISEIRSSVAITNALFRMADAQRAVTGQDALNYNVDVNTIDVTDPKWAGMFNGAANIKSIGTTVAVVVVTDAAGQIVSARLASGALPALQRIHSAEVYAMDAEAAASLKYWRTQPTGRIVESLKPGNPESLKTWADGRMMNGNTRTLVLEERGVSIRNLPREVQVVNPQTGTTTWVVKPGQ